MVTGIISRNNRRRLEIAGPDFRGQWNTKDDGDDYDGDKMILALSSTSEPRLLGYGLCITMCPLYYSIHLGRPTRSLLQ